MKQTVLIKVSMNGEKSRSKAMTIVVGVSGVESASLKGDDKSQIEVVGDDIDAVKLATLLRKKVGHAEIMKVGEKKDEKKEETKNEVKFQPLVWSSSGAGVPYYYQYPEVRDAYYHDNSCSIL